MNAGWTALMLFAVVSAHQSGAARADPSPNQLAQAGADGLSSLRRRVAMDPSNVDLRFQLARELSKRKEYVESIQIFRQLIVGQPNDADYHLGLGQALLWSNKPLDALESLRAAVKLAPDYEDAQRALGQALVAAGRLPEARQHWTQAAKRFSKSKWPVDALAEVKPPVIAAASPSRTRIEAGFGKEHLSNGSADWTEHFVVLNHDTAGRAQTAMVKLSQIERFGLKDIAATVAAGARLSTSVTGTIELGASPTHRVLAKRSLQGGLSMSLEQGYGLAAAFRQIDYNTTRLRAVDVTFERYIGDYRAAYSLHPSRSSAAGNALGHRLQLGRFYGEDNQVQILLAGGNEVDRPEVGIINQSEVRAVALFGRHWLTPYWAIAYAASHTRQDQTRRNGLTISLIGRL